jgi:hypothetical protein
MGRRGSTRARDSMDRYKYFKLSEFDSPDEPGSGVYMDPKLVMILDLMRERCGFPFHVNSGMRTKAHNSDPKVGGKENSEHLRQIDGLAHAADIACPDSSKRFAILEAAIKLGIRRIGIGRDFLHLGNWYLHPQEVVWLY